MEPLVSILIPAYNAESTLVETVQSALDQQWPRKEIIIVDDGSKDQTLSVARQLASPVVKVVPQENQGAAAARNKAFSVAQGEYIQWLDADDLLSPNKVSSQLAALREGDDERTLLSSGWGQFRFRSHKARFIPSPLWADLSPVEWLTRKWEHNAHMQTATWLTSRALTVAAGPWDTRLLNDDDGEYFFRIISHCRHIRFVAEARVYYRASGMARLSRIGGSDRKRVAHFTGMKKQIADLLAIQDTPRIRAACVRYLQTWLLHFYPERMDLFEEAKALAVTLGGSLQTPRLRGKFAWLPPLIGFANAKRVQLFLPELKAGAISRWDKFLFSREGRGGVSRAEHAPRNLGEARPEHSV